MSIDSSQTANNPFKTEDLSRVVTGRAGLLMPRTYRSWAASAREMPGAGGMSMGRHAHSRGWGYRDDDDKLISAFAVDSIPPR